MGVEGSAALRPRFNSFNTMQGGHFRLVTLGRLALERSDGQVSDGLASLNARRRKVALLAVLALARRGVSRDTLIEMFWGDQDEIRARHSLSDAVSHLRRVLGREAIVATRSAITLSPGAALVVDAVELAAAAARIGDSISDATTEACERLLAGYAGPFLDGVHIDGSATFEQWVTRERVRLERAFVRAAALRCKALAAASEWTACHELAERWLDAEPLSAAAGVAYLESLAESDDDGRVLAAYEHLCARLRREYELEPDPNVKAIATRIEGRRRSRVVLLAPSGVGGPPPTTEFAVNSAAVHHQSTAPDIDPAPLTRYGRPRIALGLVGVMLIAAAFVAGATSALTPATHAADATIVAIAVKPNSSDTSLAWLADSLTRMIAVRLSHATDVRVVAVPIDSLGMKAGDTDGAERATGRTNHQRSAASSSRRDHQSHSACAPSLPTASWAPFAQSIVRAP